MRHTLDPPSQDRYPVVVEETRRYVLWIDADTPPDAVNAFDYDPRDPGSEAMFSFDWETRIPDEFDWRGIECGEANWPGTMADAHVQAHRNYLKAQEKRRAREACAAAGHPIPPDMPSGPWQWDDHCGTCGTIDPASRTAAA
jgi:hypothetical protein